jgi:predicted anti-sigma-YlaC factor YlaD
MPKPPPKREHDPMSHVVDRLLAQLPGLHGGSNDYTPARGAGTPAARNVSVSMPFDPPTVTGLWSRIALSVTLGLMMLSWPYFRDCGLPLFGYLAAVLALVGAGVWTAVIAWELRHAAAHIVSLLILFWGVVLISSEVLSRTGYAAVSATWHCQVPDSGPSWMRWFAPPAS